MPIKRRSIPEFLISRRYISAVITFIVLFSVLFLLVYKPFSLAVWFGTDDMLRFSFTILFYVAAIVILIVSRLTMYSLQDRLDLTIISYAWWIMAENLLISLLYTTITTNIFPQANTSTPEIAVRALMCVTLILVIPNALVMFYASYRSRCEELEATQYELERVRNENKMLHDDRERRLSEVTHTRSSADILPKMVHLYDYNGTLRLTLTLDAIFFFESEDNYVKVHYKHNDKIVSYMLRCRTSDLEKSLANLGMVRCHRSYIINIRKISSIAEVHRLRYIILCDDSIKRIPISKNYYTKLLEAIDGGNS